MDSVGNSITTSVAPNKNIYFMKSPNNTGQLIKNENNMFYILMKN
jgi:hypothetical protein